MGSREGGACSNHLLHIHFSASPVRLVHTCVMFVLFLHGFYPICPFHAVTALFLYLPPSPAHRFSCRMALLVSDLSPPHIAPPLPAGRRIHCRDAGQRAGFGSGPADSPRAPRDVERECGATAEVWTYLRGVGVPPWLSVSDRYPPRLMSPPPDFVRDSHLAATGHGTLTWRRCPR